MVFPLASRNRAAASRGLYRCYYQNPALPTDNEPSHHLPPPSLPQIVAVMKMKPY